MIYDQFISETINLNTESLKLNIAHVELGHIPDVKVSCGIEYGSMKNNFLSTRKMDNRYHKVITGSENLPKRYSLNWSQNDGYVLFDKKYEEKLVLKGKNISKSGKVVHLISGDETKYKREKIIVRQSALEIIAAKDISRLYALRSFFVITSSNNDFPLDYLVAILNSSYITNYSLSEGIIRYQKGKQPQIRVSGLEKIPVPIIESKLKEHIINLSSKLTNNPKDNNTYEKLDSIITNIFKI